MRQKQKPEPKRKGGFRIYPPARQRRIQRIKDEIRRGTYETPAKFRIAIERLAKDLPNYDLPDDLHEPEE